MTLRSMTGFARVDGQLDAVRFHWELRSVNGRGLDLRLRLPPGFDALEASMRELAGKHLGRGNVTCTLTMDKMVEGEAIRINQQALDAVMTAIATLEARANFAKPRPEGVLALRGVITTGEAVADEEVKSRQQRVLIDAFSSGLEKLAAARREEGSRLAAILAASIDRVEQLTRQIAAHPARQPEVVKSRLREQLQKLLDATSSLDPDRLHQEAVLLATRADIEEELKRLGAHIAAARDLLMEKVPVGRRLDFLSQEFNREANTICSKANDVDITRLGLELKATIDQIREQVQNVE